MPGIAGIFSPRPSSERQHLLERMVSSMHNEPFYVFGTYSAPDINLSVGWVGLPDTVASHQPILSRQRDIALILTGECVADPDLQSHLRQKGHDFEAGPHAWLTYLYEERGERFLDEMNGLFSGVLIDHRLRKALLFNDRYGMERVYYHRGADDLIFASEAKALLQIRPELRSFDDEGLTQYLAFGATLNWNTIFRSVDLLPGASAWTLDGTDVRQARYFSPSTWEAQPALSPQAFDTALDETLRRVIPRYFDGESDIGLSLTGGLDTRMIVACRPRARHGLRSYTFGGKQGDTVDVQLAARVAAACDLPHQVLRIGDDFFSDFASLADRTVYITDGSLTVCGTHELYLNAAARALAPIRLTGNFGSEILRGVTTFKPLLTDPRVFSADFRQAVSRTRDTAMASPHEHRVSFAAFKEIPWHIFGTVKAAQSQVTVRTPYLDNELVALAFRAPHNLRASAFSTVLRGAPGLAEIPTDRGRIADRFSPASVLQSAYRTLGFKLDYWHNDAMPDSLLFLDPLFTKVTNSMRASRHRYLQYRRWLRRELAAYSREYLSDPRVRQSPFWDPAFLETLAPSHIGGRNNRVHEINAVLTIAAIDRVLLRQSPVRPLQPNGLVPIHETTA